MPMPTTWTTRDLGGNLRAVRSDLRSGVMDDSGAEFVDYPGIM